MPRKRSTPEPQLEWELDLGATLVGPSTVRFRVWAPQVNSLGVRLLDNHAKAHPLTQREHGYWEGNVSPVSAGTRYRFILNDGLERPDPVSRFQPEGVHGPSEVCDPRAFQWTDHQWKGLSLDQFIIYELHTGTFTSEGTFDAIISRLSYLRDEVGITAIELMPVAQFPGTRNWGYDGAYLFAPQASYGGPESLKRLVNACHAHGLAVVLDVVYNHLGPEGNYLGDFGPYFTNRYSTAWGPGMNFDGCDSDAVRHFVISNAVYWITEYHIDALRLDAIHGIFDFSAKHLLQELGEAVHHAAKHLGRQVPIIAESDLNDSRVISPSHKSGYGLDAQWNDDFHHALHCLLTKEARGYYQDFGKLDQLATALETGFVFSGQYCQFRHRRHGNSSKGTKPTQFVVYAQNHDQIGNRAQGDRLSTMVPFPALKVAAAGVLLSPNIPLLFMGEEYGEANPFLYFIDHGDPGLIEAVRQGRRAEFASFGWQETSDPYNHETIERSRLAPNFETNQRHRALLNWHQTLISLRKSNPVLGPAKTASTMKTWSYPKPQILIIQREGQSVPPAFILLGFNKEATTLTIKKPLGNWQLCLDSNSQAYGGQQGDQLAPPFLSISRTGASLKIPPYAVWVYASQE